ncbi:MAG: CBS domain-containing protein [Myxococcota bacterium]|nr:CBS domain-containing protein [Myxococcota bacterium]
MRNERKLIVAETRRARSDLPLPKGSSVEEIMSRDVLSFQPDTSLQTAVELLFERGIGGAPVLDLLGNVVGVLSKTDFVGDRYSGETAAHQTYGGMAVVEGATVSELMTTPPIVVREGTAITDAAALLVRLKLHRLPVVSASGGLVGIITTSDIVRWVAGPP